MTTKKRDSSINLDDQSTTDRTVDVDRDTSVDRDTNVDVSVEASSADPEPEDKGPAPASAQIPADQVDWTVDYGGDAVHPTEIPRDEWIIPLPEPEAPPVEPEP